MGMGLRPVRGAQMQQQQWSTRRHLAAAAREQEMLRTLEPQQQNEMARFSSGSVDGRGFGHNGGAAASSARRDEFWGFPAAGLALVRLSSSNNQFHFKVNLISSSRQQQISLHQYMEGSIIRAGSDDGRSGIGPAS
ncbi:uncharacterized protein A4U43_C07F29430 [Asparagus officinalis]|uniref:Uncharacterized protein n=1 Tax=Asparagus officinalis TaxID=4686 RepID=A0A5P1EFS3_ASPOF|nr:uncharacterized protein A4U43_C07F29430 [Asparagus officinalis]